MDEENRPTVRLSIIHKNQHVSMYLSRLTTSTPLAASLSSSTAQTVVHPQLQQNQWGPGAVSNIIFGSIMVVIGALALWQGHLHLVRTLNSSLESLSQRLFFNITSIYRCEGEESWDSIARCDRQRRGSQQKCTQSGRIRRPKSNWYSERCRRW